VLEPLAVIDIGSNSGRLVVVSLDRFGHLQALETIGTPLRLVHDLADGASLSDETIERTLAALRGFQAVARGAGAKRTIAVATAAVREAANGEAFIDALRCATGLEVELISAEVEARFGFLGAVYGVPVEHGAVIDLGGGSMQISTFRDRRLRQTWSLPLGALRLSDRFLLTDPPTGSEVRRLQDYVRRSLEQVGIPKLQADEQVVGTGGTIRGLARIKRADEADSLIPRLHGYVLEARALSTVANRLAQQSAAARARTNGLNASRFDSIAGGALCAQVTLDVLGGDSILVSGQGLREGICLALRGDELPSAERVREAAVASLAARFATSQPTTLEARVSAAEALVEVLDPEAPTELREGLRHAATVLDIGRSIDLYNRHEHTTDMLMAADLVGFSHRGVAVLGALVRLAGKNGASLKRFAPLVGPIDQAPLNRLAAILALADALAAQAPPADSSPRVRCERRSSHVALSAPWLDAWSLQAPIRRLQQIFAVQIETRTDDN
jgi:exopolyphosphatase / guanosine-5'-triphosphate,3'-diphosphate pyrophosphatase